MSTRGRTSKLDRRRPTRTPKAKVVIFTEGTKTEPGYFKELGRRFPSIIVEIAKSGMVPLTLAKKAVAEKKARRREDPFAQQDQYWTVFDRDEHPNIDRAATLCESEGIEIAFSNPCFELWLILHSEDFGRQDGRHQVQKHFASICRDYDPDRNKSADFGLFFDTIDDAERRAEALCQRRSEEGDAYGRPMTTVYRLTREIRKLAQST